MGWCGFGWVGGLWGQVFVGPGNRVGLRWMLGVRFATLVYPLLPIHPSATLTLLTILPLPSSFLFSFVPFYPLPLPSFFIVSTSPKPINLVHVLIYCPIHLPPSCLYIHATTNTTNESSHESHEYRITENRKSEPIFPSSSSSPMIRIPNPALVIIPTALYTPSQSYHSPLRMTPRIGTSNPD